MSWDRAKAVDHFMKLYSKYDPDQYKFRHDANNLKGGHDAELALKRLYIECASAAEKKETLLAKLDYLIKHGAEDTKAFNGAEYKSIIKLEASDLHKQIENGSLFF